MKKILSIIFAFVISNFAFGQSILEVPAAEANGDPIINGLIKYVVADTNAQGKQLHDIYKLQRGKTYFYNQGAVFNNPITLIADEPGTTDDTKPPKFLVTKNDAGEVPGEAIITTFANLTCNNIAFSTVTVDGEYSWANAIYLQSDNLRIEFNNCIFELIGWAMIEADGIEHSTFILNKCLVRNGSPYGGDEWVPFFIEGSAGSIDTVIARNCTFTNIQGSVVNIEPQAVSKYMLFDHNTFVNIVQNFTTDVAAHLNTTITNNIFYNVGCYGAKIVDVMSGGDQVQSGVIQVDTLVSNQPGSEIPHVMDEKDRSFVVKNNAYFWSKSVHDYWTTYKDSVARIPWMSSRELQMFGDKTHWPKFIAQNNVEVDPGFKNFGGTDAMVSQMHNDRIAGTFGFWGWDPDSTIYPDVHWAFLQWPLPEDFSYTASLTSTDSYHVGSLVWYPSELVNYEKNLTGVENDNSLSIPTEYTLNQNYPNPFNPVTKIVFSIPRESKVQLEVFDILGRKVASIINEVKQAGNHTVDFDASQLSSGVYIYQLSTPHQLLSKKMMVMK